MLRFVFVPAVVMSGYLFHGVRAFCVRYQNILWFLLFMLFLIWWPSIVIDECASSNRSLGPILVDICWFPCLCLVWVLWVRCYHIVSLHHVCGMWCMHCVRVIFNVFFFLVSFLLCDSGRKVIIIILSQHCIQDFIWMKRKDCVDHPQLTHVKDRAWYKPLAWCAWDLKVACNEKREWMKVVWDRQCVESHLLYYLKNNN